MDGCTLLGTAYLPNLYNGFQLIGTGDFNGDGKADLLWQTSQPSQYAIWLMDNTTILNSAVYDWPMTPEGGPWSLQAVADFNGDGKSDLLWLDPTSGQVVMWFMDGTSVASTAQLSLDPPNDWYVAGADDYNGDGNVDILWEARHGGPQKPWGDTVVWFMNGSTFLGSISGYGPNYPDNNPNYEGPFWSLTANQASSYLSYFVYFSW